MCNYTYSERSEVHIATPMIGCGYVFVKWSATGNIDDEMCGISHFDVMSSYGDKSNTTRTSLVMYNFTGLPDDTLFNVTVVGINFRNDFIDLDSTSVRTMVIESKYVCTHVYI